MRDRVALIDPPFDAATRDRLGIAAVRDLRQLFDSTYAALYFPWLEVLDPLPRARSTDARSRRSGHVAGQIARDRPAHRRAQGAGQRAARDGGATRPSRIDDASHGLLNTDGINVIRAVPGRGLRIAGARLVSSDLDFRFLNVRRLLLMIERSHGDRPSSGRCSKPNNWLTRAKLALRDRTASCASSGAAAR